MSDNTNVANYFENVIPQQFANVIASASADVTGQPEMTATYEITGEGGASYGLRFKDGALEVVPGGIADSDLRTIVSLTDWQQEFPSAEIDPVIDYYARGKVEIIQGVSGAVKFDLTREDGPNYEGTIIFNNVSDPEVIIRMSAPDYKAMMAGELNGQMAFMTGKLKFEGSLPLLMQLGSVAA